jgi:ribosome modulation factor
MTERRGPSASADACKAKAYRDGYNARVLGQPTNPYPRHTLMWTAWLEGWLQAGKEGW